MTLLGQEPGWIVINQLIMAFTPATILVASLMGVDTMPEAIYGPQVGSAALWAFVMCVTALGVAWSLIKRRWWLVVGYSSFAILQFSALAGVSGVAEYGLIIAMFCLTMFIPWYSVILAMAVYEIISRRRNAG